ncbi:MAG: hypothetical protein ACK2UR_09665 [Candidatus Promineifilaceae bacterium]|jgi:hypothetical protein
MNRSRFFIFLLLTAVFLLTLSACGGGGEEATPTVVVLRGPDVPPTEVLPATPTERVLPSPTAEEMEAPTAEATAVEAEPTVEMEVTAEMEAAETDTPEVVETDTPEPALVVPAGLTINGMTPGEFIIMPPAALENVRAIYAQGQELGRNPDVFSILGDSLIATPQSLAQWDQGTYVLGDEYGYLQRTIDRFSGSFGRYGPSVRVGLHSWSVFDPLWADKDVCQANEDLLNCELRLSNPSFMLVFLGSNDAGVPGGFIQNYRQVVQSIIDSGVVPILATKADRFEGPDNVNNLAVRQVADEMQLPLLEFDLLANTLAGRGLGPDGVHLTFLEPLDYTSPGLMSVGYPVHNLAVLMILDEVSQEIGE